MYVNRDPGAWESLHRLAYAHEQSVECCLALSNGTIVTGCSDIKVRYEGIVKSLSSSLTLQHSLHLYKNRMYTVVHLFYYVCYHVKVWDVDSEDELICLKVLKGHIDQVFSMCIDGWGRLISGSKDMSMKVIVSFAFILSLLYTCFPAFQSTPLKCTTATSVPPPPPPLNPGSNHMSAFLFHFLFFFRFGTLTQECM